MSGDGERDRMRVAMGRDLMRWEVRVEGVREHPEGIALLYQVVDLQKNVDEVRMEVFHLQVDAFGVQVY